MAYFELKLKCTIFDFGWGSATDPTKGDYSAPQTPWLDFRGLLLRETEDKRRGENRGVE